MKSVMLAVSPEVYKLIAEGKQRIYLEKRKPSLPVPFTCYICEIRKQANRYTKEMVGSGLVFGKFICSGVDLCGEDTDISLLSLQAGISEEEAQECVSSGKTFAWRIDDVEIFDEPRELADFCLLNIPKSWCYIYE